MRTKIWLIAFGAYEDYRIERAFTNRELAVQYIAATNGMTVAQAEVWLQHQDAEYGSPEREPAAAIEREHHRYHPYEWASIPEEHRHAPANEWAYIKTLDLFDELPIVQKDDSLEQGK